MNTMLPTTLLDGTDWNVAIASDESSISRRWANLPSKCTAESLQCARICSLTIVQIRNMHAFFGRRVNKPVTIIIYMAPDLFFANNWPPSPYSRWRRPTLVDAMAESTSAACSMAVLLNGAVTCSSFIHTHTICILI
jgi:hypothetical protein